MITQVNSRLFRFGVGAGDWTDPGVSVELGEGDGVGLGFNFGIATPLFQINFLPFLMHVYFFPEIVEVAPIFVHAPPGLTTALALNGTVRSAIKTSTPKALFIQEE